ncbi:hypothetical protein COOONC_17963 [Cooperia oncophora]
MNLLAVVIVFVEIEQLYCSDRLRTQEFQRYDGWNNNRGNPGWGSVGSRLLRDSPANYEDGRNKMNLSLPSARVISELVFKGAFLTSIVSVLFNNIQMHEG